MIIASATGDLLQVCKRAPETLQLVVAFAKSHPFFELHMYFIKTTTPTLRIIAVCATILIQRLLRVCVWYYFILYCNEPALKGSRTHKLTLHPHVRRDALCFQRGLTYC
jgi:hypothetical protein